MLLKGEIGIAVFALFKFGNFFVHFCQQYFFRRQIEAVLAGNDLLLAFRQAEFDHGIVFVSTQQDADGRIFMRQFFNAVVVIDVHL